MSENNGFDPHEHLTDIRGKPYLPVDLRYLACYTTRYEAVYG